MKKIKNLLLINIAFFIYSLSSLFSKYAGISDKLINFILFYGLEFCCLGVYAILWQKILNKTSLVGAYLNKAIIVLWGLIFGIIFFQEKVTIKMVLGIILVISGVVIANYGEAK